MAFKQFYFGYLHKWSRSIIKDKKTLSRKLWLTAGLNTGQKIQSSNVGISVCAVYDAVCTNQVNFECFILSV